MRRGTTPTVKFSLPFDIELVAKLWLTVSQRSREVFTKTQSEIWIEEGVRMVSFKLSQDETLLLRPGCKADMQVRILTVDGEAFASQIQRFNVEDLLKEGVI